MPFTRQKRGDEIGWRDKMAILIVTAGLILQQGKLLVTQRREGSFHGLLWEFPGGKMEEGEGPEQALQRELKEELGIKVKVGRIFDAVFYADPINPILLLAYWCFIEKGPPKPIGCRDLQWVSLQELQGLSMPPADQSLRDRLCQKKGNQSLALNIEGF